MTAKKSAPAKAAKPAAKAVPVKGAKAEPEDKIAMRRLAATSAELRAAQARLKTAEEAAARATALEAKIKELEGQSGQLERDFKANPNAFFRKHGMTFEAMVKAWSEEDEAAENPALKELRGEVDALKAAEVAKVEAEKKAKDEREKAEADARAKKQDDDYKAAVENITKFAAADEKRWALAADPESVVGVEISGKDGKPSTKYMGVADAVITLAQLAVAEERKKNPTYRLDEAGQEEVVRQGLDQAEAYLRKRAAAHGERIAKVTAPEDEVVGGKLKPGRVIGAKRTDQSSIPNPTIGAADRGALPQPAAREDDEQQREHAEAERQPAIHRQDTCARHLGGAGQVRQQERIGKDVHCPVEQDRV